jgi:agmatinase
MIILRNILRGKTLSYPAFLGSEVGRVNPDEALFHVIPVPYEKTVTYGKGTGNAPSAILEASQQLELYDGSGVPADKGIYTAPPHNCTVEPDAVLDSLGEWVAAVVAKGKVPVILGGEHTVTAGALRGVTRVLGPVGVVQFDAHADLRDRYEKSPHNHACAMRRVLEQGHALFQVGVRSLSMEEVAYGRDHGIRGLNAETIARDGIPERLLPHDFPNKIYVTIDVDCLDPSAMPATGTPEPGGLTWYQLMGALSGICGGRAIVGFDVVELAPIPGFHAPDFTVARLVYQVMGLIS